MTTNTDSNPAPEDEYPEQRSIGFRQDDDVPSDLESEQLLARYQSGSDRAVEVLLGRYTDRLHRIARALMGPANGRRLHGSMDIVQETLLAATPKLKNLKLDPGTNLLNWLSRIVVNRIRDAHRFETAGKRDIKKTKPRENCSSLDDPVTDSADSPSRTMQAQELRQRLDECLGDLTDDQRLVFVLREYSGESWENVGLQMNRSREAAREVHQRALRQLQRSLGPWLQRNEP